MDDQGRPGRWTGIASAQGSACGEPASRQESFASPATVGRVGRCWRPSVGELDKVAGTELHRQVSSAVMPKEAFILLLEDSPRDAELVERELRRGGIGFVSKR